jgi:hypothetical protein
MCSNNKRLIKPLSKITNKSFPRCMKYIEYVETYDNKEEDNIEFCLCGKRIKKIHVFKYKEILFNIGNICINSINYYKENEHLINDKKNKKYIKYIDKILKTVKQANLIKDYKKCLFCGELKIKNKEYKITERNSFCNDCLFPKKKLKCINCKTLINISLDYKKDIKKKCYNCWKATRN